MSAHATRWAWNQILPPGQKVLLLAMAYVAEQDGRVGDYTAVKTMTGMGKAALLTGIEQLTHKSLLTRYKGSVYLRCPHLESEPRP